MQIWFKFKFIRKFVKRIVWAFRCKRVHFVVCSDRGYYLGHNCSPWFIHFGNRKTNERIKNGGGLVYLVRPQKLGLPDISKCWLSLIESVSIRVEPRQSFIHVSAFGCSNPSKGNSSLASIDWEVPQLQLGGVQSSNSCRSSLILALSDHCPFEVARQQIWVVRRK